MKTSADILAAAADLLEKEGWCQGENRNAAGAYCTWGAINEVAEQFVGPRVEAINVFGKAVGGQAWLNNPTAISFWNDAPERTGPEVIATLRRVAGEQ